MKLYLSLALFAFCGCTQSSRLDTVALVATIDDTVFKTGMDHKLTESDLDRLDRHYPGTLEKLKNYQHLEAQDVINLVRAGVSDDVIINEIHATRSTFFLTPKDEEELSQAGVSRRVILAMKHTVDDRY
jgi:hypothetical protein